MSILMGIKIAFINYEEVSEMTVNAFLYENYHSFMKYFIYFYFILFI